MTPRDLALLDQLAALEASEDFWAYRQYMNPKQKMGWWQRDIARVLTEFYGELIAGKRPKYVIEAPPQHGKSVQVVDFISWLAGKDPERRTIYTSFSERLGVRANLRMQRLMDSPRYARVFPGIVLGSSSSGATSGQALRNREILEFVNHDGYFRNTTVRGSITGEGLDLGVIDDPLKGREQAGSKVVRDAVWDWFTDDFFSRFSEDAGMLAILTRWHVDDPIGRLVASEAGVRVFKYPAIAVRDERHRKAGEPLFPEHKSLDFLLERKKIMSAANWSALYQQNPVVEGGEVINTAGFKRYRLLPPLQWRKIYADTAQKTAERNDYSVLECWGKGVDGHAYLVDLIRGKWEAPELRRRTVDFWNKHKALTGEHTGALRKLVVEDKSSGTGLIQDLRALANPAIPVEPMPRNRDKYVRINDATPYIDSGYVWLPEDAPWVNDFITEAEEFTADDTHAHDDQIDPMCDAIEDILRGGNKLDIWKGII